MAVIDHDRALGADHLDPGGRKIRVAERQAPAAADDEGQAAVHRHRHPLRVGDVGAAARLLHRAVVRLRIDAHRLRRLEAPEQEIEVVRALHRRRRELDAPADLLAQAAGEVAADERAHRPADRAVADALAHVGVFRVEALRVADGELEVSLLRQVDQFVGLRELDGDRLFEEQVLARGEHVARDRVMRAFRRRRYVDRFYFLRLQKLLVVRGGGFGPCFPGNLRQPLLVCFRHMQAAHQRMRRQGLRPDAAAPAGADHCHSNGFHADAPRVSRS